jgi:hypothetical protein
MSNVLLSALVTALVGAVLGVATVIGGTALLTSGTPAPVNKPVMQYGER